MPPRVFNKEKPQTHRRITLSIPIEIWNEIHAQAKESWREPDDQIVMLLDRWFLPAAKERALKQQTLDEPQEAR